VNDVEDRLDLIHADWPAPDRVCAVATQRHGGISCGPFASLNLALHTGDSGDAVLENRRRLQAATGVAETQWLNQVHGTAVVGARKPVHRDPPAADAVWTRESDLACAVLTADCLPVLFCDREGSTVAAAHAGWRGLVAGVLENTIDHLGVPRARLLAWLGPGISGPNYEVGADVRAAVVARHGNEVAAMVLTRRGDDTWSFDLYGLARRVLARAGVHDVYGGGFCTLADPAFYSYRRDRETGRMATLVWLR
jgi:polyphenol oxidase